MPPDQPNEPLSSGPGSTRPDASPAGDEAAADTTATDTAAGLAFEDFYLASRRRLVLEAYALTGDLSATRSAVRDAFTAARHHWAKVSRLPDPEEWVRPRAWAMAQRRHVGRIWHRETGIGPEQKQVLDALHHLPDQQRKILLLVHLAGLTTAATGRELGETTPRVERQLALAVRSFCEETGTPPDEVPAALESLGPLAEAAALPPVSAIEDGGRRRRRTHALVGTVLAVALTLVGGVFVTAGGDVERSASAAPEAPAPAPVTEDMLLTLDQVRRLAPGAPWRLLGTSDNTSGTGINTVCQNTRFADPRGRGAFVRKFAAAGTPRRDYLQTVEVSRSEQAAAAAYRTTLGWFAGCAEARLQLLNAYRVRGLGEEAQMLKLRIPGEVGRTYVVGLARSGALTVSTVLETRGGRPAQIRRAASVLTTAVRNLCESDPSGPCPTSVRAAPVLPPPSGETPGTLAVADLPVVGKVNKPWVGTKPRPARPNVAATTCDRADFIRAGAPRAATRTFLIPQARLPKRFGITQTVGRFAGPRKAHAFVQQVSAAMARCEKRDLGAQVSSELAEPDGYRGSEYALWRLDSEINDKSTVGFWMGVTRVGPYVAQVTFTPAGPTDIDEVTFQALITRARDRLFELPRRAS
jgi:DNA-directed RNA polymerase specialized sigma24 family protein